jgi:predicted lipid-binding transport protein (Tim44 family)
MSELLQEARDWFRRRHAAVQHGLVGASIGSLTMGLMVGNFGIAAGGGASGFSGWFTGLWVGAIIGVSIWGWFKKT